MKWTYIFLLVIGCSQIVMSQQDQLFTQFAHNKIAFNPAYSAQQRYADIAFVIRDQWNGLEGAPSTQLFSGNLPFANKRIGLGLVAARESIGIEENVTLRTMYSYAIQLQKGILSGGLELSGRRYSLNFNDDRLTALETVGADPSLQNVANVNLVFNTGVGFYYRNKDMYMGVSLPRILHARYIDNTLSQSKEVNHLYIMTGATFRIRDDIDFVPQLLVKLAQRSPFDLDLQLGIVYQEEYHAGINYRAGGARNSIGESIAFMFGLQPIENLFFGLSYDITLSPLRKYDSGSLEVLIKYSFGDNDPKEILTNPRYF